MTLCIAQLPSMLLVDGAELLLKRQPFVLLRLLLAQSYLALLAERLRLGRRLRLKLRTITPGLHLPHERAQQAHADQAPGR